MFPNTLQASVVEKELQEIGLQLIQSSIPDAFRIKIQN
jgi:hypothetical protein